MNLDLPLRKDGVFSRAEQISQLPQTRKLETKTRNHLWSLHS
jgi:hypothetical protein